MKKIILLIIVAALCVLGYKMLNSDPEKDAKRIAEVQAVVDKPIQSAEDKAILSALTVGSSLASSQLEGKSITKNVKFVSMSVGPGRRLSFVFKRTDLEEGLFVVIKSNDRKEIANSVCANQFIRKVVDSGYAASIDVEDKNGKPLTTINVVSSDCK